ncbi:MAG: hypothetical protein IPF53_12180 [Blastocatellia bacterium]|nr:hypothetical protein [Blastocatellia bacterium]MBK6426670.1 hypothetical protein [Blastocatellia bacterium]
MTPLHRCTRTIAVALAAVALVGCQLLDQTPPEEKVAKAAFDAIKTNNWKAFTEHVATHSDFIMRPDKNANPLTGGHTMGSALIRAEEMDFLHAEFDRAVSGGENLLDFKRAEYVSLGAERKAGVLPLWTEEKVDYTIYSFRVRINGVEQDTAGSWPRFMLVKYEGKPKVFAIMYGDVLPTLFSGEMMFGEPGMPIAPPMGPGPEPDFDDGGFDESP